MVTDAALAGLDMADAFLVLKRPVQEGFMRDVSTRIWRGVALAAALVVLAAPAAWADEPPAPTDPPQARVQPPVGLTAASRIQPPVGNPATDEQNLVDLFLTWLRERAGLLVP